MRVSRLSVIKSIPLAALIVVTLACSDSTVVAPTPKAATAPSMSNAASREHLEFDVFNDYDIQLSCMNGESTHWEGTVHVAIDITTTPSGVVNTSFALSFAPTFFVERENGVRYYAVAGFPLHEHHTDGPLTLIAGTAAGVFKSDDGDTLPLGFHVQVVYDRDANAIVDWKFTGVCP
jgi:hypothetical protein